jgi:dienelactone hydrolase
MSAGQYGKIEFMSSTPASRWSLARSRMTFDNTEENPVTIWGDLLFPKTPRPASGKYPAVVVSHGSEGVSSLYYDVWAKAFLAAGYAVFIVDSQAPRGRNKPLAELQLTWNTMANVSDSLRALKVLSTHPDIDPSRIFNIGFSRGASASMSSAWPIYQRPILPDGVRYAGHIALYPGCNFRYHEELTAKSTAPMLWLLGEKDDMTPAQPCAEYAEYLTKAGNDVRHKIYPGAYHVFDRLNQPWRKVKEGTFADCFLDRTVTDRRRSMDGLPYGNYRTGERFTSDAQMDAAQKECGKEKFITVESNPLAREAAVKDTLAFMDSLPAK